MESMAFLSTLQTCTFGSRWPCLDGPRLVPTELLGATSEVEKCVQRNIWGWEVRSFSPHPTSQSIRKHPTNQIDLNSSIWYTFNKQSIAFLGKLQLCTFGSQWPCLDGPDSSRPNCLAQRLSGFYLFLQSFEHRCRSRPERNRALQKKHTLHICSRNIPLTLLR